MYICTDADATRETCRCNEKGVAYNQCCQDCNKVNTCKNHCDYAHNARCLAKEKQTVVMSVEIDTVVTFNNGNFLHVQTGGMGNYIDFTAVDCSFKEIDGGQYDVDNVYAYDTIDKMVAAVLNFMQWEDWGEFEVTELTSDQLGI